MLGLRRGAKDDTNDGDEDSESSGGEHGDETANGEDGDAECTPSCAPRVDSAQLVELESTKLEAMRSAIGLACSLMAVDDVLVDGR